MNKVNFKKMDKNQLLGIITSLEFDLLTDDEAFDVMQRYNELNGDVLAVNTLSNVEIGNITINIIEDK